jgi:thioredoxin 2
MSETLQVACPHCGAINRVPSDKPRDGANCGKCHVQLFPDHPIELSAESFRRLVAKSEVPMVVDFWADWCAPCRQMAPEFAKAALMLGGKVRFGKLDTQRAPEIVQMFGIRGIPALILFNRGQEIARITGARHHEDIADWLRQYV